MHCRHRNWQATAKALQPHHPNPSPTFRPGPAVLQAAFTYPHFSTGMPHSWAVRPARLWNDAPGLVRAHGNDTLGTSGQAAGGSDVAAKKPTKAPTTESENTGKFFKSVHFGLPGSERDVLTAAVAKKRCALPMFSLFCSPVLRCYVPESSVLLPQVPPSEGGSGGVEPVSQPPRCRERCAGQRAWISRARSGAGVPEEMGE